MQNRIILGSLVLKIIFIKKYTYGKIIYTEGVKLIKSIDLTNTDITRYKRKP